MRKSVLSIGISAMLVAGLASCSDNADPNDIVDSEVGTLAFTIDFKNVTSRSDENPEQTSSGSEPANAVSNAIPTTSWDNIQNLQLFLYDRNGVVYFSDYVDAARIRATIQANPSATGKVTYTYSNVPAGFYYLTAVANVDNQSQSISTKINGMETTWNADNVLGKYIYNLRIEHKEDAFPIFYTNQIAASGVVRTERPYAQPSEVFFGKGVQVGGSTVDGIEVLSGKTVNAEVTLKREVSMMRLRLNLAGSETNTNNADVSLNPEGKVDFSSNAVIMLATLPECIMPMYGDMTVGGVQYIAGTSSHSVQSSVLVTTAVDGNRHFYLNNPMTGYTENSKIIGIDGDPYNANAWRDIIVFPNDKNRQYTVDNDIIRQNRYLLIISARGLVGHVTKEGELTEEKPVYWVGYINEPFEPNKIREVNVTFLDGGTQELPERPDNVGNLTVSVSAPEAWDSNILASKIEL